MNQLLELFPYQQEGIAFALEREGALIADQPGLGKSAQAIGVINQDSTIAKILIICPASVRIPWRRELERWLGRPRSIGIIGVDPGDPHKMIRDREIVIINYDRLIRFSEQLSSILWDLCVLDECHYAKSLEAKRTRMVLQIKARRRIALSGTPLLNRPIELYPTLAWLSPVQWPINGLWAFATRFCGARHNGFGWDLSGASNLQELAQRLRSTVMIRRTKAQVLTQLPPKIRTVVELYPDESMQRLLKREMKAFETARLRTNFQALDGEDLAILRHVTALFKAPLVIQYASELLDGGVDKVVIFAHHRDVIVKLQAGLSQYHPVILWGGMGAAERQASIDAFMTDGGIRVFIGNIQAAGTGITLAPASSHCLFAEMSWVPAEMTQAEDRLHRISTRDCVTIHHLVLAGSLDAIMVKILIKKQRILDAVLEDTSPSAFQPAS